MKESVLKSMFVSPMDDKILLTVDEDRVYRVYWEDERLSHNREFSLTRQELVTFDTFIAATRMYKKLGPDAESTYLGRLIKKNEAMGVPVAAFKKMIDNELAMGA